MPSCPGAKLTWIAHVSPGPRIAPAQALVWAKSTASSPVIQIAPKCRSDPPALEIITSKGSEIAPTSTSPKSSDEALKLTIGAATSVGMCRSVVDPSPSCPEALEPQHRASPEVVRAQV